MSVNPTANDDARVYRASGVWTLDAPQRLQQALEESRAHKRYQALDLSEVERLDTEGAIRLLRLLDRDRNDPLDEVIHGVDEQGMAFLNRVVAALDEPCPQKDECSGFILLLERTGRWTQSAYLQLKLLLSFVGQVMLTLVQSLMRPTRLRWISLVHHMESSGLDAVPIVGLLSFLVGAVVAFLGSTILSDFGAQVFTVELVSYSFLREFGVLLTAILIAGRSGSAYTAQIGAMKGNEEIDALRTLGVDPVEVLVVPRLLALLIMLPVLTFLAMILGIVGGAIAAITTMDLTASAYIVRLYERTEIGHFWVGMIKAPVFAYLIAVVGCLEGFKVSGSAESVGRHTTSSVVQSIFLVIFVDALFAIFFMEIGL
ncbi:MAG: ABC transporter permease [Wenzhouxiangellaceae bacterium]